MSHPALAFLCPGDAADDHAVDQEPRNIDPGEIWTSLDAIMSPMIAMIATMVCCTFSQMNFLMMPPPI